MKGKRMARSMESGEKTMPLPCVIGFAVCFLGGVFLGQVLAGRVPESTGTELRQYLTDFLSLDQDSGQNAQTALSALMIYFRYPLTAFLLGFVSAGTVLLPCVAVAYGFFLSFSVCCFTAAFGGEGVVLALAVFGLRCLVTMPCFFLLAVPAWKMAVSRVSIGRGRRAMVLGGGRAWWLRFAAVALTLLAGVCAELFLSPYLLRLILERILN